MKKLALILLLAIFVLSQLGFYCFYALKIYAAKQVAKEQFLNQIPEDQLTRIMVSPGFVCSDEEIILNGQIFDVVKRISQNGKVYLLCIADADEAKALNKLSDLVHSGAANDSNGKDGVKVKISVQDLFYKEFYSSNENSSNLISLKYCYDFSSSLSECTGTIPLPPPKIYSSNFITSPFV